MIQLVEGPTTGEGDRRLRGTNDIGCGRLAFSAPPGLATPSALARLALDAMGKHEELGRAMPSPAFDIPRAQAWVHAHDVPVVVLHRADRLPLAVVLEFGASSNVPAVASPR